MSEFEHYSPETFGELAEIEQKISQLIELRDSGKISEDTRPILQNSIEALQIKAAELAGDITVTNALSEIAQSNQQLSAELDQIVEIVGDETFLGEEFQAKRNSVIATQEKLAGFAERYPGAEMVAREAGSTALSGLEEAEIDEAEVLVGGFAEPGTKAGGEHSTISQEIRGVTNVELTFAQNVVRLGHNGKVIPYCSRRHEGQADHSDIRRKALMFMVSTGSEKVSPFQIWEAANPDEPFDNRQMGQIRAWLDKLTFRRAKLIAHHKRGAGSRYWVDPRFKLSMNFDMEQQESEADEDAADVKEPAKPKYELDYGDCYLLAVQLSKFNDVLGAYRCGEITQEMLGSMEKYCPDLSHLKGDDEAVLAYRSDAQARVGEFIANESKLLRFLDRVKSDSPILDFVEFLSDLDEGQRKLVNRLVLANRKSGVKGTPRGIVQLPEGSVIVDKEGREILIPVPCDTPEPAVAEIPQRPFSPTIESSESQDDGSIDDWGLDEGLDGEEIEDKPAQPESDRDAEIIAQLRDKIIEYSIVWSDSNLDPEKTQPSRRLAKAYHSNSFSQRNLAAKFTRSKFKSGGIDFVDAVVILLTNDSAFKGLVKRYSSQIKEIAEAAKQAMIEQKAAKS